MKNITLLVLMFLVGLQAFSQKLTLDVALDYFPEAKAKGCNLIIEHQRTGVTDTLTYSRNKFKVKLHTNTGIVKTHFVKEGYVSKTIVINTQAKTKHNQIFYMEIDMIGTENTNETLTVATLNYVLNRDEFTAVSSRFF